MRPGHIALLFFAIAVRAVDITTATEHDMRKQAKSWLKEFDHDSDGQLDEVEFGKVVALTNKQADPDQWMHIVDADNDGMADEDELVKMLKLMQSFRATQSGHPPKHDEL